MLGAFQILFKLLRVNWQISIQDNIESNVYSIANDTTRAAEELGTASNYQRKAGKRAACLMIIIVAVICIVLLAVSYISLAHRPRTHADRFIYSIDSLMSVGWAYRRFTTQTICIRRPLILYLLYVLIFMTSDWWNFPFHLYTEPRRRSLFSSGWGWSIVAFCQFQLFSDD